MDSAYWMVNAHSVAYDCVYDEKVSRQSAAVDQRSLMVSTNTSSIHSRSSHSRPKRIIRCEDVQETETITGPLAHNLMPTAMTPKSAGGGESCLRSCIRWCNLMSFGGFERILRHVEHCTSTRQSGVNCAARFDLVLELIQLQPHVDALRATMTRRRRWKDVHPRCSGVRMLHCDEAHANERERSSRHMNGISRYLMS